MANVAVDVCTICGAKRSANQPWFLVSENHWEDKLRILHWHDELAQRRDMHRACSAAHVQELVVHWMTTGSLDHPFAKHLKQSEGIAPAHETATPGGGDPGFERLVVELAVHRESLGRALNSNLLCLGVMLDELFEALNHDTSNKSVGADLKSAGSPFTAMRQI